MANVMEKNIISVTGADFLGSYPSIDNLDLPKVPRIAIAGRSNVGKSTFLNRLTGRKQLARTSSTPGQTRSLNVFNITLASAGETIFYQLIDLPGFGYARVSKAEKGKLHKLVVSCLESCPALEAVCLLNDCRREPEEDELLVMELTKQNGHLLLVVLTKCDKLTRQELTKCTTINAKAYGLAPSDLFLSGEGMDTPPLWEKINSLL